LSDLYHRQKKKERRVAKPRGMCVHSFTRIEPMCRARTQLRMYGNRIGRWRRREQKRQWIRVRVHRHRGGGASHPPLAPRSWDCRFLSNGGGGGGVDAVARAAAAGTGKASLDRLSRSLDQLSTKQCWAASDFGPVR